MKRVVARTSARLRHDYRDLIPHVLREARLKAGLTQQQLADRLGRPQTFVAKAESSRRRVDVLEFVEWAEALKVNPSQMIDEVRLRRRKQRRK